MLKGWYFDTFACPRRLFHFSWKKWTCTPQRGRMVAILSNATHMRSVKIWVRQTQNPTITSRDVSLCVLRGLAMDSLNLDSWPTFRKTVSVIVVSSQYQIICKWNYRPNALLPSLSKGFEKRLHKHIYKYLEHHKLLIPNNSGFRKKHSTLNSLLSTCSNLYQAYHSNLSSKILFLDISKAFDRVDHTCLLWNSRTWYRWPFIKSFILLSLSAFSSRSHQQDPLRPQIH